MSVAGIVRNDGTGSELGAEIMISVSSVLRRERGRPV